MERKVITNDEDLKYLRQISKEVDLSDKSYVDDIKKLKEYCATHEVFAMAAVQVGIPKRLIYIKSTDLSAKPSESKDESIVLINPTITFKRGETESYEACESCSGEKGYLTGLVKRPYCIGVDYYDKDGVLKSEEFSGMAATVFSHENDHLDGILHIDLCDSCEDLNFEERTLLRKEKPYKVISKDKPRIKDLAKRR